MTQIGILGGGPAGLLMAVLLAKRGHGVQVFERRADPRLATADAGRSINLALAARGIRALREAGVMTALQDNLVPMRGRQLHNSDGSELFAAYSQHDDESIFSVSRSLLTRELTQVATRTAGVSLHFNHACTGLAADGTPLLHDALQRTLPVPQLSRWIAADGAGSAVRHALQARGVLQAQEQYIEHDYKELDIPAGSPLVREALHIWPRGGFMLIALPNADGSFTATLFLARDGAVSFAALQTDEAVQQFFAREFADVAALIPALAAQFAGHPQSRLGSVYAAPWHLDEQLLLIGDAAHAMVPFHGQGMNCAFEDCRILDELLADGQPGPFARFSTQRKPDADAIVQMALENHAEMSDSVRSARFTLQRELALQLQRRHPQHFVPRYSMVTFRDDIGYATALNRGRVQQQLLDEMTLPANDASLPTAASLDWAHWDAQVTARLTPL